MLFKKEKQALEYFYAKGVGFFPRPFKKAAEDLGIPEPKLLGMLCRLRKRGVIRNLRGLLNHRAAGYAHNALIAWRKRAKNKFRMEKAIKDVFLADDRISHCYRRKPRKEFNYPLFTMMHAKTGKEIADFARRVARGYGLDYALLFTERELKRERLALQFTGTGKKSQK